MKHSSVKSKPLYSVLLVILKMSQTVNRGVYTTAKTRRQYFYPQKTYNLVNRKGKRMSSASQVKDGADQFTELRRVASFPIVTLSISHVSWVAFGELEETICRFI